ncbi:hypothetical protein [Blautia sp. MSJ-19]|uniref:hypothetical protein n=1 Tax=Blautia sp. MSJ-19 TaxID=2841517 RepID=UPI001C0EB7CF|nr:hypothetical protein [Blautia sp. MSJ-19]MBU5479632.1 hypothetical protein [Blautia sp. MSJ-19]
MAGVIYLILSLLTGKELAEILLFAGKSGSDVNSGTEKNVTYNTIWILLAAAFGMGTLVFGWGTYMISWAASELGASKPLIWGDAAVMLAAVVILGMIYRRRYHANRTVLTSADRKLIADKNFFHKELILAGILLVFSTVMMFYVFFIKDGVLYSGFTVYGDYAPHTAMMRSFSRQNNFPTQYPHFGGQDVKYHFMFQFFVGNLEFLGIRMDIAYNTVSVLALAGFLMLLYCIARRLTGSLATGVMTVVLFFFRSSLSFFRFVAEHLLAGNLWETLKTNTTFIGYTTNENWGLWNFNVYLNQRHLAFGLLIVALVLWIFLDWLDAGCADTATGGKWFLNRFFTKRAWICRCPENALMAGMFLGLTSFWNGAAVIGGLLILMGFAVFSDGKLDYLILAVTTVVFSVLQTKIFIWGNAVSPSFYWGFLAERKTLVGVLWYLLQMSGIFFIGAGVLLYFIKERKQRAALISFLFPTVFAFCASLTPDIAVNHKYIMISYAFLAMFWAWAAVSMFRGKMWQRILAVLLVFCLTVTGVYDFVVILRNNGEGHRVTVNMESELTDWLSENLTHDDLILTPEYSINEVTMSGVMMYMGWPYYAWSAGYDTYYRAEQAKTIYSTEDAEELRRLVRQEKITYILFEEGMEYEQEYCREETIAGTYRLVYETEDGRIRIYET